MKAFVCQFLQTGWQLLELMIGDTGTVFRPMNLGEDLKSLLIFVASVGTLNIYIYIATDYIYIYTLIFYRNYVV